MIEVCYTPEKVKERANANKCEEDAISAEHVFVLKHEEGGQVEHQWIEALGKKDQQGFIKCKKISSAGSTDGREFVEGTLTNIN